MAGSSSLKKKSETAKGSVSLSSKRTLNGAPKKSKSVSINVKEDESESESREEEDDDNEGESSDEGNYEIYCFIPLKNLLPC